MTILQQSRPMPEPNDKYPSEPTYDRVPEPAPEPVRTQLYDDINEYLYCVAKEKELSEKRRDNESALAKVKARLSQQVDKGRVRYLANGAGSEILRLDAATCAVVTIEVIKPEYVR